MSGGMADADFTRPARPSLIPGIYNYCDTRCPHCPFNRRCAVYLQQERMIAGRGWDDAVDEDEGDPRPQPPEVIEAIAQVEERVQTMTREEWEKVDAEIEARRAQVSADRLVIAARYYTMTAWRVTQALRPIAEERGDSGVIAAVETIAALAGPIASKTYRAVSGAADEDFDRFDLEGDANGSAKVARSDGCRITPGVAGADGDRPRDRRWRADGPGPRPGRNRRGARTAVSSRDVLRSARI